MLSKPSYSLFTLKSAFSLTTNLSIVTICSALSFTLWKNGYPSNAKDSPGSPQFTASAHFCLNQWISKNSWAPSVWISESQRKATSHKNMSIFNTWILYLPDTKSSLRSSLNVFQLWKFTSKLTGNFSLFFFFTVLIIIMISKTIYNWFCLLGCSFNSHYISKMIFTDNSIIWDMRIAWKKHVMIALSPWIITLKSYDLFLLRLEAGLPWEWLSLNMVTNFKVSSFLKRNWCLQGFVNYLTAFFFPARFLIWVALGTVLSSCYQESLGQSFDAAVDTADCEPQVGQMTRGFRVDAVQELMLLSHACKQLISFEMASLLTLENAIHVPRSLR